MIGQGGNAVRHEQCRRFIGFLARQAIDDAALAPAGLHEIEKLAGGVIPGAHGKMNVRPVEPGDEDAPRPAEQLGGDVVPGRRIGGRRKGADGDALEAHPQAGQGLVIGAEGRTPARDAMGLVDGDELKRQPPQGIEHALRHQAFGRHVEQPHLARRGAPPGACIGLVGARRMDRFGIDAGGPQRRHLILHERHQGRHDQGQAALHDRRNLKAQGLAGAGRHDRQHMLAGEQGVDDRLLAGAEPIIAEDPLEDGMGIGAGGRRGVGQGGAAAGKSIRRAQA